MLRKLLISSVLVIALTGVFTASAGAHRLANLIAPERVCAGETDLGAPAADQLQAMRCMTNFARHHAGLHSLGNEPHLDRSAGEKADDIVRCQSFSHEACGRRFTFWMGRVGYLRSRCWRAGENIAWGQGQMGDVRSIFIAWVHSPEHLANILGRYGQLGIGLDVGRLHGHGRVSVWTQHFGSHCGAAPRRPHGVAALAQARGLR